MSVAAETVAQVSKPAVSPISKSAGRTNASDRMNARTKAAKTRQIEIALAVIASVIARDRLQKSLPLTTRDIAAICGVSQSAIFQIEQKAIKKLRRRLRIALGLSHADLASFPVL